LMYDLRASNLSDQALGAIHDHAQNTVEPTAERAGADRGLPTNRQAILFIRRTARLCERRACSRFAAGGKTGVRASAAV
jgi:hypothetical protein